MASEHPKLQIHTANIPKEETPRTQVPRLKARLSFQDRLLRNSFLACAVLLGVLALGNVNQPWADQAASGIRQALTMELDLDESLGQLSFVQKLMPESALVFFNLNGGSEFVRPVQGELTHSFDPMQPWLMFSCAEDAQVLSPADGIISAVSPLSDGGFGVLIDHGNALESVMAGLDDVQVQVGDEILRGAAIGICDEDLYYELRQGGDAIDPGDRMGL